MMNPKTVVHEANFPWHLPEEFRQEIMSWLLRVKSPYSHSYYNLRDGEKSWDYTPIGSLRISDHWNFYTRGATHCPTDIRIQNGKFWTLARWNGEVYEVQKTFQRKRLTDLTADEVKKLDPKLRKQWEKKQNKAKKNASTT